MDSYSAGDHLARTEAFALWEAFLRSDASEYGVAFWRLAMQVIDDIGPPCAALQRHQALAKVLLKLEWTNYGLSPLGDETSRPQ